MGWLGEVFGTAKTTIGNHSIADEEQQTGSGRPVTIIITGCFCETPFVHDHRKRSPRADFPIIIFRLIRPRSPDVIELSAVGIFVCYSRTYFYACTPRDARRRGRYLESSIS